MDSPQIRQELGELPDRTEVAAGHLRPIDRHLGGPIAGPPGQGHARHNHPGTEEIIYVVSGEGEQTVDDAGPVHVRPGASIFVPTGVHHSTLNTGKEPMRLLVVYCPTGAEIALRGAPGVQILPPSR